MSYNVAVEVASKELQLPSLLAQQEKVIDSLHGLVESLNGRLQSISRSEPAPPSPVKDSGPVAMSTVMDKIRNNNKGIQLACDKVQEMLRLLEV